MHMLDWECLPRYPLLPRHAMIPSSTYAFFSYEHPQQHIVTPAARRSLSLSRQAPYMPCHVSDGAWEERIFFHISEWDLLVAAMPSCVSSRSASKSGLGTRFSTRHLPHGCRTIRARRVPLQEIMYHALSLPEPFLLLVLDAGEAQLHDHLRVLHVWPKLGPQLAAEPCRAVSGRDFKLRAAICEFAMSEDDADSFERPIITALSRPAELCSPAWDLLQRTVGALSHSDGHRLVASELNIEIIWTHGLTLP
ncbi:hypothetical protein C8R44DRAFT_868337 [Mycena epipterygia]|nr:hypothetical protein C8R44DRAFT_868337 [Mycena epipterygia]